jgi:uncharacterized protein YndB with AHSA1/START domain
MKTQVISIDVDVKATLNMVWMLWTEAQHIEKWNYATDSWHTPKASNDLKVGGKFYSRMEAKDGSSGFDFEGTYTAIEALKKISYELKDGRKVIITFAENGEFCKVHEEFEPDDTYPISMQQDGWLAILMNFKRYAEQKKELIKLSFQCQIRANPSQVEYYMLDNEHYKIWTKAFNESSNYIGEWKKGNRIKFIGIDENGNQGGMISLIRDYIPSKFISIEHLGIYSEGKEILDGDSVNEWLGCLENYIFEENEKGTLLKIEADSTKEFEGYLSETWPKALIILKNLCESTKVIEKNNHD